MYSRALAVGQGLARRAGVATDGGATAAAMLAHKLMKYTLLAGIGMMFVKKLLA